GIDEVDDVDRLRLVERGGLEVVLRQHDEPVLRVLVPFDEIVPRHGRFLGFTDALVSDRFLVLRVQQPELRPVIARGAVHLDRDVADPERNGSLPYASRHRSPPRNPSNRRWLCRTRATAGRGPLRRRPPLPHAFVRPCYARLLPARESGGTGRRAGLR